MTYSLRGVLLRLSAACAVLYTVWFVSLVAVKVYNISVLETPGIPDQGTGSTLYQDTSLLIKNLLLLAVFLLQHSLLKCLKTTSDIAPATYRILYIATSTLSLHVIYYYWEVCTPLFSLNLTTETVQILHILAWAWLSSSVLLVDFSELFGFKHIQHEEQELGEPLHYKQAEARRLLQHYRHPIAVGPLIVLFASKVLTTDRLLLSLVFLLYSFFRTNLDYRDYLYLRYVSYPAKRYKFQKIEIRSRATKTTQIHSSVLFSDDEDAEPACNPVFDFESDPGYCSSPTFHKADYYKILAETPKPTNTTVTETTTESNTTTETTNVLQTSSKSNMPIYGSQVTSSKSTPAAVPQTSTSRVLKCSNKSNKSTSRTTNQSTVHRSRDQLSANQSTVHRSRDTSNRKTRATANLIKL